MRLRRDEAPGLIPHVPPVPTLHLVSTARARRGRRRRRRRLSPFGEPVHKRTDQRRDGSASENDRDGRFCWHVVPPAEHALLRNINGTNLNDAVCASAWRVRDRS
jgi:hypothetical protein